MRISGNEPSSVILTQTNVFQMLKIIARKCQEQPKPKGMVQQTHKITISFNSYTENFDALNTLRTAKTFSANMVAVGLQIVSKSNIPTVQINYIQMALYPLQ